MENNIGYDGEPYLKISNLLFGAIVNSKNFLTDESKVFMVILFKTIGFKKDKDWLTWKQIKNYTGINHKQAIYRAIRKLQDKNLITKDGKYFKINQNFEEWLNLDNKNIELIKGFYQNKKVTNLLPISNKKETNMLPKGNKSVTHEETNLLPPSTDIIITNKIITDNKDIYSRDDPVTDFFNEEKNKIIKNQIEEIINYLNTKADKNFRASSRSTIKNIAARLKDGYSLEDFKKVINIKTHKWKNTDYDTYLRPETLFGTKFESYLNEKIIGGNNVKFIKHFENERVHNDEDRAKIVRNFYGE